MIDIDDLKRMVFLLEHAQQNGELSEVAAFNLPVYKMALRATELEAERDALAAENAALKGLVEERCWVYDYDVEGYRDAHDYLPETPATDAYANQLRAEGAASVGMLIRACAYEFPGSAEDIVEECAMIADNRAINLRKENGNG